jgi:hypothetical protein
MCSNLRNKSYYFNNKQLTKEEYKEKLLSLDLGSYDFTQEKKKEFEQMKLQALHRFAFITNSYDVSGNNIDHAKNCHNCFDIANKVENCKNIFWSVNNVVDVYDSGPGVGELEVGYEVFDTGAGGGNVRFGSVVYYSDNVEYSFNCYSCSYCFGCLGLRNKKYCILNKQYEKEEYFKMRDKIIEHMNNVPYLDKKGNVYRYGEFFPSELSTFCYNETVAQDYFPQEKERAIQNGFSWKEDEVRSYKATVFTLEIPDNIKNIPDSITTEIIECAHKGTCKDRCSTAFRITKEELLFYRRFNIPLPRICYGCRHCGRLNKRNPMKLWHRSCMKEGCSNEFETSYAPDRPEVIYCERCYQNVVV